MGRRYGRFVNEWMCLEGNHKIYFPLGFAVNLNYLAKFPNCTMPYKAGYEEDAFLRSINLKIEDIEPKANDCSEVYVWHTRTTKTKAPMIRISKDVLESTNTNLEPLMKFLDDMGVSHTSPSGGEHFLIYYSEIIFLFLIFRRRKSNSLKRWKLKVTGILGSLTLAHFWVFKVSFLR